MAVSSRRDPELFDSVLQLMESEPVAGEPVFLRPVCGTAPDEDRALAPRSSGSNRGSECRWLKWVGTNTIASRRAFVDRQCFGSLRALARLDFRSIFEATSLVEAELRTDSTHATQRFCDARQVEKNCGANLAAQWHRRIGSSPSRGRPGTANQSSEAASVSISYGGGRTELERDLRARMPFPDSRNPRRPAQSDDIYLGSLVGLTGGSWHCRWHSRGT